MFNGERLKDCFFEHGYYSKDIAEYLKITPTALSRKIKGGSEFTRDEIEKLIKLLELTPEQTMRLFFMEAL